MNTGKLSNLINTLIRGRGMIGLVKRLRLRKNKGAPRVADGGIAEYLPTGSLRRIRLSDCR